MNWIIGGTLKHHGVLGQKWGVRRYQNTDGTLTEEGKRRYGNTYKEVAGGMFDKKDYPSAKRRAMSTNLLKDLKDDMLNDESLKTRKQISSIAEKTVKEILGEHANKKVVGDETLSDICGDSLIEHIIDLKVDKAKDSAKHESIMRSGKLLKDTVEEIDKKMPTSMDKKELTRVVKDFFDNYSLDNDVVHVCDVDLLPNGDNQFMIEDFNSGIYQSFTYDPDTLKITGSTRL